MDRSGVRAYYVTEPREHSVGLLQLGDKNVHMNGQKVRGSITDSDLVEHIMQCPSTFTRDVLAATETLTVFSSLLHLHGEGYYMRTQVFNEDGTLKKETKVEYYDGDWQAASDFDAFEIVPGDSFKTECVYRAGALTEFGPATNDEMCIDFMYYYPRHKKLSETHDGACGYEKRSHPVVQEAGVPVHQLIPITDAQLERRFSRGHNCSAEGGSGGVTQLSSAALVTVAGAGFVTVLSLL
mmetsp:Transcript_4773/g.11615  ORF Transcript_4773/g.11615 Transcript_4773/m.11615 type:complete len:239 (-) Transcript_4773:234-950(-)